MDAYPHPPTSRCVAATLDAPGIPGAVEQQPPGGISEFDPNAEDLTTMLHHVMAKFACAFRATEIVDSFASLPFDDAMVEMFENVELASLRDEQRDHQSVIDEISKRTAERLGVTFQPLPQPTGTIHGAELLEALRNTAPAVPAAVTQLVPRAQFARRPQARRVRSSRRVSRVATRSLSDPSEPAPSHPARPSCQAQGREHDGSTTSASELTTGFVRLGCGTLAERGSAVLPSQATDMGGAR